MSPDKDLHIVGVDRVEPDKLLVEFSDETQAMFTLTQLLSLKETRNPSGSFDWRLGQR
jgi:hypothetical protein